jgi:protease I
MSEILMIIPPEKFRDDELFISKAEFEKEGHSITIASIKKGIISGSKGGEINSEAIIDDVKIADYDGVVFIGGEGSKLLFNNPSAIKIAKQTYEQNKIISAICLAPVILANAGVLKGKKATVFGTELKTIESKGAIYAGRGVAVDGNVVTGNAPKSAALFAKKINELLKR